MISRPEAIQRLLNLFDAPRYLEIGVDHGQTFLPLKASRKVAVDPKFNFDFQDETARAHNVQFHEVTSDTYFAHKVDRHDVFDVVFLDGLHVAEQTIRDLLNAVIFLDPNGVIIIDDVIPDSYHSSLRSMSDLFEVREFLAKRDDRLKSDQAWMGDVFKLPFFVNSFMQQFSYATVLENHGQTILWRQSRRAQSVGAHSLEDVGRLEFKDFVRQRSLLNLTPLSEIIHAIQASRLLVDPSCAHSS